MTQKKIIKGRLFFVGLHHKPHLPPLCTSTKTGKIIKGIVEALPFEVEVVKTNLYDREELPASSLWNVLAEEWHHRHETEEEDVIVLLGAHVHNYFFCRTGYIIKIAHPASRYGAQKVKEYTDKAVDKIIKAFEPHLIETP